LIAVEAWVDRAHSVSTCSAEIGDRQGDDLGGGAQIIEA
jgi:hypothetical protein